MRSVAVHGRRRQRGSVIITVSLMLLFLLGFMGFALDFGRLFIVKGELQTAMDSCALAAAQELDGMPLALTRARNAGKAAGDLNRVNLQSGSWDGKGKIDENSTFIFRNATYNETTSDTDAKYVECQHTQQDVRLWLVQALGAFTGELASFPSQHDVAAGAIATRGHSQTTCPMPLALRPKNLGDPPPHYGYTPGEWVPLLREPSGSNGFVGWANLDGSRSASTTAAQVRGSHCGSYTGAPLGTPGWQASIAEAWNARFGIYRGDGSPDDLYMQPDLTGYSYTEVNWPTRFNAYAGITPLNAHATAANFQTKRQSFASCADTSTAMNICNSIIGRSINFNKPTATPGSNVAGGHFQYGLNRRVVTVPITTVYPGGTIEDYACMLLLQPMDTNPGVIELEFIGNASEPTSPCVTNGLPGGSAGPLVPVLVR